eukprot:760164-Hanusia_phi.AAC.4
MSRRLLVRCRDSGGGLNASEAYYRRLTVSSSKRCVSRNLSFSCALLQSPLPPKIQDLTPPFIASATSNRRGLSSLLF